MVAVDNRLQYFRELFAGTERWMLLEFRATFGLSFYPRFYVSVFSEPVGFIFEIMTNLCDLGDISILGSPPVLDFLEEEVAFGVLLFNLG